MNSILDYLLEDLRRERHQAQVLRNLIKEKTDAFKESIEDSIQELDMILAEEDRLREKISELALSIYRNDPEHKKDIHPKVKERDTTILTYNDADATRWCIQHTLFLHVATKSLEGYIKSLKGVGVPSWVTVEVVPTITIAQEL